MGASSKYNQILFPSDFYLVELLWNRPWTETYFFGCLFPVFPLVKLCLICLIFGGNGTRHMTRILSNKFKYITLKFLTEQMSNINCRLENISRNSTGKKNLYKKKMVIYWGNLYIKDFLRRSSLNRLLYLIKLNNRRFGTAY